MMLSDTLKSAHATASDTQKPGVLYVIGVLSVMLKNNNSGFNMEKWLFESGVRLMKPEATLSLIHI